MTVFQQTVEAVKQAYPKFSPACLSLSCRTRETGVTMTAKAMSLADSVGRTTTPYRTHSENRKKSINFRCRMSLTQAETVKEEMAVQGLTQQELLETLLLRWVKENRHALPTHDGSVKEMEIRASSVSENITNI